MHILMVGDLHFKRGNIKETRPLIDKIVALSKNHDLTVHFGDIYNNHGAETADVVRAVTDFFDDMKGVDFVNIEGNHDQDNDGVNSSLYVHKHQSWVKFIAKPFVQDGILMVPFIRSSSEFERIVAESLSANPEIKIVFCHQEFNGAQFENGFYAPGGADPTKFPGVIFISGHIHEQSKFANVWYVGAPRWLTKSDANSNRGVWSVTIEDGKITRADFISSEDVSPCYHKITITPQDVESKTLPTFKDSDKVYVEYTGDKESDIKAIQKKYHNLSLKHTPSRPALVSSVSESKGVAASVEDYLKTVHVNMDRDTLIEEIRSRMAKV